jgi:putative CocE/NonD family hydrolase
MEIMKRAAGLLGRTLLVTLALASAGVAQEKYRVVVKQNVPVRMRDGTVLRADIYRPQAPGKFPVLLERTAYDKRNEMAIRLRAAARGYVVVIQDVRGRYASQGEWYPLKHESSDGYDTVEWAAALPYSDGKVGMFGSSYLGITQMLAAIASPPHLAGIFPVVTGSNYHNGRNYQGGAFEQWFNESWTSLVAQNTLEREMASQTNAMKWKNVLPLGTYPLLSLPPVASLAPYFRDALAHPRYDAYWKRWSIEEHYPDSKVPAYCAGAWYDIFQEGTLRNYLGIRSHGGSEAARRETRLRMIVGGHSGYGRKVGSVDFGPTAVLNLNRIMVRLPAQGH